MVQRNSSVGVVISRVLSRVRSHQRRAFAVARRNGSVLFLQELIRNPGGAGAPCPSSRQLGARMAEGVLKGGSGLVVEIGAGTGVVTNALLEHGVSPDRLLVIERSPALFDHLKRRFPQIRIVLADAGQLQKFVPTGTRMDAIVSSIPFRSLPFAESEAIIDHWSRVAPSGTQLIQYTYALRGPLRHLSSRFVVQNTTIAWWNLPPARVVSFQI